MPTGTVQNNNGVLAWGNGLADFIKMKVHRCGVGIRQCQSHAFILLRTYGTEEVGTQVLLLAYDTWTSAFAGPDTSQRALLTDAVFVLEPDLDCFKLNVLGEFFLYALPEVFLKASCCSKSA